MRDQVGAKPDVSQSSCGYERSVKTYFPLNIQPSAGDVIFKRISWQQDQGYQVQQYKSPSTAVAFQQKK